MPNVMLRSMSGRLFCSFEAVFIFLWVAIILLVMAVWAQLGEAVASVLTADMLCSDAWYRSIEESVPTDDGHGHGPDVGSDEWKSVVEFKLGIRGKSDVPKRDSEAWCRFIDQMVQTGRTLSISKSNLERPETVAVPSFDCDKVRAGSIEEMICEDEALSALDRKLSHVYAEASRKATNEHPPLLKAQQRGWIKGRNECWKSGNRSECLRDEYKYRIAELQARYRLVPENGPVRFICEGSPANEVLVTFFRTDPPTLIAERGDSVSLMYQQPSGSGTRYQGRNESFWEHQGEALIVWGHGVPEIRCKKAP